MVEKRRALSSQARLFVFDREQTRGGEVVDQCAEHLWRHVGARRVHERIKPFAGLFHFHDGLEDAGVFQGPPCDKPRNGPK